MHIDKVIDNPEKKKFSVEVLSVISYRVNKYFHRDIAQLVLDSLLNYSLNMRIVFVEHSSEEDEVKDVVKFHHHDFQYCYY